MSKVNDYLTKRNITLAAFLLCYYIIYSAAVRFNLKAEFFISSLLVFTIYRFRIWTKQKEALKLKGLTPGDINNIAFVKYWEITRKTGAKRYCLLEGGLMIGLLLFAPMAIVIFILITFLNYKTLNLTAEMFVSKTLLIVTIASLIMSYLTGVFVYLNRWLVNERRFINLTDPLHKHFS